MKKVALFTAVIGAVISFQACQNAECSKETKSLMLQPNDSLFHINESGYSFNIILPKDLMIENEPVIGVNSSTGELNIQLGNQFWIVASLEKADMTKVKAELGEDMLFGCKVMEENPNSLLFQRILPDGTEYDYSYRYAGEIGGKSYFFKTCEEGEFSMENVGRMKQAISTIHTSV